MVMPRMISGYWQNRFKLPETITAGVVKTARL
jgi:hypothetical protein